MWVAKLRIFNEKNILIQLAKKHRINLTGYPLSYYKEKGKLYLFVSGNIIGDEKNKKLFLNDLQKETKKLEVKKDFLIALMEQPVEIEAVYDPEIIHIKPVFISSEGYQDWEMASWNREKLGKAISVSKQINGKLLKLKQEKISNISTRSMLPEMTSKQKNAFELALRNGYYEFPRHTELKELAKLSRISLSTYQAHLRKAEKKIMAFSVGYF